MRNCSICIILLLIFIFSVGAISAQDLNDTSQAVDEVKEIGIDDSDLLSNSPKSFKDLDADIPTYFDNVTEFNMTDDYAFNAETDENFTFGMLIGAFDLTINGNNHTIDAKNQANIFQVWSGNVTINDLTLINCNKSAVTGMLGSNIVLNNVKFIDNGTDFEDRSLIYAVMMCNVTVKNCSFYSTTEHNTDILAAMSDIFIEDSTFSGGKGLYYSTILVPYGSNLYVNNSTFTNLSAKYASAIYCEGLQMVVRNSKFKNLHSDLSAGAIGYKFPQMGDFNQTPVFLIENCIFENTSSSKDAGAIFFDSLGMLGFGFLFENWTVDIINCTFNNCSSNFGGAILHLWGNLTVADSTFMNNKATSAGGAIYTSCANLNIVNSTLSNNVADYQAGAIFFDEGNLTISNSNLTGNKVTYSAIKDAVHTIYAYDANVTFENSSFNNPGLSVIGVFSDFEEINTTYIGDELSKNNTEYEFFVARYAMSLELVNNSIYFDNLPAKFDLRDYGWVGNVYHQGNNGGCWAVGSVGALESALLKATDVQYLFSPNNMQNMQLIYSKYGSLYNIEGGNVLSAPAYLLSWLGLQSSEEDPYDELGKISDLIFDSESTIHVQDVIVIPAGTDTTDVQLKEAIIKYGAFAIVYGAHGDTEPYYYPETAACYYNDTHSANHLVDVVGWDDNYSKDNFFITPPGDGAWICKNSWGTDFGEDGFFYLSYYDQSFLYIEGLEGMFSGAVGYIFNNTIPYTINYQTDFGGLERFDTNYTYYSNEFTSLTYESLGAVGTYFNDSGIDYELKIYVNDELKLTQTGVSEYAGFKTIILEKYIPVIVDDVFRVEFKSNSVPFAVPTRQHFLPDISSVSIDGENWIDTFDLNSTVCLKAYTVDYVPESDLEITKSVSNSTPHKNEEITWSIVVTNTDRRTAVNTMVSDELPDGLVYVSDDSDGAYNPESGIWNVGDLASGQSATLNIITLVSTTNRTIVNAANVSSETYDPNERNRTNCSINISPEADLEIFIVPGVDQAAVGDRIVWTVNVVNHGPDTAANAFVLLVIPDELRLLDYKPSLGTYDPNFGIWIIGDLACGETANLLLDCEALEGGTIIVQGLVVSDAYDPNISDSYGNASINVTGDSVSKEASSDVTAQATMHTTANPIAMLLLALLAAVGVSLRRKV